MDIFTKVFWTHGDNNNLVNSEEAVDGDAILGLQVTSRDAIGVIQAVKFPPRCSSWRVGCSLYKQVNVNMQKISLS